MQVVKLQDKEVQQVKRLLEEVKKFFEFLGIKNMYIRIHFQKTNQENIFAQSYIGKDFESNVSKEEIYIENGIIRLTELFFKQKRVFRISILIHEIIHLLDKQYQVMTLWRYSTMIDHIRAELSASVFEYLWLRVYNKIDDKIVEQFLEGVYQDLYNSYFKGLCSYQLFKEWFIRSVKILAVKVIRHNNITVALSDAEEETLKLLRIFGRKIYEENRYIR